jgi:DNA-binding FadR family transcriptional regulator/DNA-binding winged helix-turn-helix (wHTH) protein
MPEVAHVDADVALDAAALDAARHADRRVILWPASADALDAAPVLWASLGSLGTLRGLRARGARQPCVVLADGGVEAERRYELEPVLRVDAPTADALAEALRRHWAIQPPDTFTLASGVTIDLTAQTAAWDDLTHTLTARECALLAYLAVRCLRVVEREELLLEVFGYRVLQSRSVEMAISRPRRKIERDPRKPVALVACRPGYRLHLAEAPPDEQPCINTLVEAHHAAGVELLATLLHDQTLAAIQGTLSTRRALAGDIVADAVRYAGQVDLDDLTARLHALEGATGDAFFDGNIDFCREVVRLSRNLVIRLLFNTGVAALRGNQRVRRAMYVNEAEVLESLWIVVDGIRGRDPDLARDRLRGILERLDGRTVALLERDERKTA